MMMVVMVLVGKVYAAAMEPLPLFRLEKGEKVGFVLREETKYVALYYSASWCLPCQKTTPALIEEYQRMLDRGKMPVEIVLVGNDDSEEKTIAYMKKYKMPWPALVWGSRGLVEKYAADGIPHLVLVELATGKVIAHGTGIPEIEAVVKRMREMTGVDADSPFSIGSWLSNYSTLIAVAVSLLVIALIQKWKARRAAK